MARHRRGTAARRIGRAGAFEIEAVTNPQPRAGKKDVSQEQKNLKQAMLGVLDSVRDESTDKAPVRIVLEPRAHRKFPGRVPLAVLLRTPAWKPT